MKRLQIAGDVIQEASRIQKGEREITGYDEKGILLFSFKDINNWDSFELMDGAEWDFEELSKDEELADLKRRQDESENAILSLMDMSLMGGM